MNNFFKILISVILCFAIIFSFAGCSVKEEDVDTTPVKLSERIETAILQYPNTNELFRYNVYDTYVEITECLTSETVVEIPDEIEKLPVIGIRESAFKDNMRLKTVIMGNNILFIKEDAFRGCENLKDVSLPNNLEELGPSAFMDCISIKKITIPTSLSCVEKNAFRGCTNLEKVMIDGTGEEAVMDEDAEGYRSLSSDAFSDCPYLKSVWIANDISSIDSSTFDGSTQYLTLYGYAASSAARFASENLLDYEVKDKSNFHNTIALSNASNIPNYNSIGESVISNNFAIKLLSKKEYTSIGEYKPAEGNVFLVLTFEVTNKSGSPQYFNYLYVKTAVSGYTKYPTTLNTPNIEGNKLLSFNLAEGETKTGYLIYEVNENWRYIAVNFVNYAGFDGMGNIDTCLMAKH